MGGSCISLLGLTIAEVMSLGFSVSFLRFLLVGCVIISNFLFFPFTSSSWSLRTLSSVLSNISRCDFLHFGSCRCLEGSYGVA